MPADPETARQLSEAILRLPEHVRALLTPAAYDHPVQQVELVQTHISYVILAGDHAYKLKKAVDLGFLDFRSLEQRRHDCLEEVRLNSRTCASLYYGVLPVTREGDRYRLGGPGEVADYAVHMRRIPPETVLANLLDRGAVTFDMVGRLVWKLARFHASAESGERAREIGGYRTMVENWQGNLEDTARYVGRTIPAELFGAIHDYADQFLASERELFRRREQEGRVRDCHGDLRADAVAFDGGSPDGVCLFDCLEFSERYRFSDVGLDMAFLAMDIERRGHFEIADFLQSLYTAATGDKTLPLVSSFFKCYRALIRGKVASILAGQTEVPQRQRRAAVEEARVHFELARAYTRPNLEPQLVMVMGLTGSGKSVLAGALAHRAGAVLLSTDIVRKELAGEPPTGRLAAPVGEGIYTPQTTERVYAEMAAQAGAFLAEGRAVVLDGTFLTGDLRAPVFEVARKREAPLLVVECHAPEDVVRQRQERRRHEPWTASDATWDVYLSQKSRYQPPAEAPPPPVLKVDTSEALSKGLEAVLSALARRG